MVNRLINSGQFLGDFGVWDFGITSLKFNQVILKELLGITSYNSLRNRHSEREFGITSYNPKKDIYLSIYKNKVIYNYVIPRKNPIILNSEFFGITSYNQLGGTENAE